MIIKLGIDRCELRSTGIAEEVAVGGERHCSLGVVSLPLSLDGVTFTHDFQVFDKFHQALIIGIDFLKIHEAIFNVAQNTLTLSDPVTHQAFSIDLATGLARVKQSVTIYPKSLTSVQVDIQNLPPNSLVLLEPSHLLPEMGLAGAKCLLDTENNNSHWMQIINPNDYPITLAPGAFIATACTVGSESVTSLDTPVKNKPTISTDNEPLHFDLSDSDLTHQQKQTLHAFLQKYKSVFASNLSELGNCSLQPHKIETGNAPPVRQRFYRQSPEVNAEMNRQLDEMLDADIIEESTSMWRSLVVMVKKKNGQLRFAVDYRKLNAITKQHTFPLPRLEDVFDTIGVSFS